MHFSRWMESVNFPTEFTVKVQKTYLDQPTLEIEGWGFIRLFYSSDIWIVHMLRGEQPGAATPLYFAALWWALVNGDNMLKQHRLKPTYGQLASDSTLSPDAIRARVRFQQMYHDYLDVSKHPSDNVQVHRGDGSDWRRPATDLEASVWRLKKRPPFEFMFV